ncbi:predicted protein [Naegleria gruberi]|uniref:Predicted protein n=1 Tax=Naegleria gruberi TaxID=5762 RepID=D2V8E7_NAEGR|nr:uncharacterized protein NAEGRDRAFT_65131 [Naegleria gruberi]EFC47166.1 predicted protein [Naegleria gruberi]|eukprot:XP_002679910.1 predicted protein [Naegleria gruberi strain NEG-M]
MDKCDCKSGWTGQFCEIPTCFGLASTAKKVCAGHGDCISSDKCSCNSGWFGADCSIHSCNGTSSQDLQNVCNGGRGQCIGTDLCLCNETWTGQLCEIPKCFAVNSSDISVCSSHGQCINADTCRCNKGWFGADCSVHSCNGTSSQDVQNVCNNGNGDCVSTDVCSCNPHWTGQFCEIPKCFGLPANYSNVCAGHGKCLSPDVCLCNPKWFGAKCDSHSCFGIPSFNSSVCSSHGQCTTMDTCKCFGGYDGETCSSHTCFGFKSNNDSRVCTNGQGKCTGPNQCTCLESESGRAIGPQCETILCKAGVDMWLPQKDPKVCSQHGICKFNMSTVGCFCEEGYEGPICQYPICYGISSNSKKVCNGVGKCNAPNNCSCFDNDIDGHFVGKTCDKCKIPYSGINCTVIEKCNATLKCNSHGTCDGYGFCTCFQDETNGYWNGTNCNTCNDGFYGEDCMTQMSNVHFNNEGNGLLFKMTSPNHFTSLNVDCNNLLDSSSISSFGSNVVCRYSNKTSNDFIIELGTDHSIQVDQEILLNRNVFNRNKLGKDYQSFKIGNAENPIRPTIWLNEFKSFIPENVFNQLRSMGLNEEGGNKEASTEDKKARSSVDRRDESGSLASSEQNSKNSMHSNFSKQSKNSMKLDAGGLFKLGLSLHKEVSVLNLKLYGFSKTHSPSEITSLFGKIASGLSTLAKTMQVTDLQIVSVEEFQLTFVDNKKKSNIAAMESALKICKVLDNLHGKSGKNISYAIGISSGAANIGNLGNNSLRCYSIVGPLTCNAKNIGLFAKNSGCKVLADDQSITDASSLFVTRPVDRFELEGKQVTSLHEIIKENVVECDEWLYEVEQHKANQRFKDFQSAFTIFGQESLTLDEVNKSLNILNGYLTNNPDDKVARRLVNSLDNMLNISNGNENISESVKHYRSKFSTSLNNVSVENEREKVLSSEIIE